MTKFLRLRDNTALVNVDNINQIFIVNNSYPNENLRRIFLELTNGETILLAKNLTESEAMTKLAEYQENLNNCYN